MKREMNGARFGDIVRVSPGTIYHYGIFVSEDEVIQFGLPPTIARKRQGEGGYDVLHNNCEHFADECAFGEKHIPMTDDVRAEIRAVPIVHVYAARFPFDVENEKIVPPARANEIEDCSNPNVRSQKYYAWKLLEKALMCSFGLKLETMDLKRLDNGKWVCSACHFSISHSGNCVAAAISRMPIGVDIEKLDESRFTDALADKIVTKHESAAIRLLEESERRTALNVLWTKKEAIFKLAGDGPFHPKRIETSEYSTVTKAISRDGERYIITVASEDTYQAVFRCDGFELDELTV